jgi:hypothetical protein
LLKCNTICIFTVHLFCLAISISSIRFDYSWSIVTTFFWYLFIWNNIFSAFCSSTKCRKLIWDFSAFCFSFFVFSRFTFLVTSYFESQSPSFRISLVKVSFFSNDLASSDPAKCINDHTLRSDTEFCRTSLLKLSDKCPTKSSDKILPGRSESLHSQIAKL